MTRETQNSCSCTRDENPHPSPLAPLYISVLKFSSYIICKCEKYDLMKYLFQSSKDEKEDAKLRKQRKVLKERHKERYAYAEKNANNIN